MIMPNQSMPPNINLVLNRKIYYRIGSSPIKNIFFGLNCCHFHRIFGGNAIELALNEHTLFTA
ncbi:hypothetical protein D3C85_1431760 [compost metagenome]